VYRYAHSHNIFIDYFRGMGVFALVASVALVMSAVARGANFMVATWHKGATDRAQDMVIAALYCGATFYLLANMLSDSMSPTTSFIFWMMYFGAYLAVLPDAPVVRAARHLSTRAWTTRSREPLAAAESASV
jgi:O-antigen ligase